MQDPAPESSQTERKYRVLLDIATAVNATFDIHVVFEQIRQKLQELFRFDRSSIVLKSPQEDTLRFFAVGPEPRKRLGKESTLPMQGSISGWVVEHGKPRLRTDLAAEREPFEELFFQEGMRSYLSVPLSIRRRVIGALNLGSFQPGQYAPGDLELLSGIAEPISQAVNNALSYAEIERLKDELHAENISLRDEIRTEHHFYEMIGESDAIRRVLRAVEKVAPTGSTVLLRGETGTGKELLARAIHQYSPRGQRTLFKVNCSALSESLVLSELFGHERGAFTGAIERKLGRFELADGSTLFLDEIGELSPEVQAKLLRVLQDGQLERVGGTKTIHVDVRVIAATNRNLDQAMREGKFRTDLFFRLNVFPIEVPPLRERKEDIEELTLFFLKKYAAKTNKRFEKISQATLDRLIHYDWPGNVRELENVVERGVILCDGAFFQLDERAIFAGGPPRQPDSFASIQEMEKRHILEALRRAGGRVYGARGAAQLLGLKPSTLQSRMKKLRIRKNTDFVEK